MFAVVQKFGFSAAIVMVGLLAVTVVDHAWYFLFIPYDPHPFFDDFELGGSGFTDTLIGVAVMIFEDRESANAANDKVLKFVQASLHDLDLGDPEIIAGEVLVNIESDA